MIDSVLEQIQALQIKKDVFYERGQFPSQRGKRRRAEDNTIFFNSLIAFTLQNIQPKLLHEHSKEKVDSICNELKKSYPLYQNASGIQTFNFWKTVPPAFFPNSGFLLNLPAFHIPDDADCTSMIYLTDTSLDKHKLWLQKKLGEHANLSKSKIKNTFRNYRTFKAYSTWFGKKMPVEFDICVQSNILYFVYKYQLPLTVQDEQTLLLIHSQIQSGDYLKYAYYLSPSYKRKAIVLYHLARLMENHTIPILEDCRQIIKRDIELELKKSPVFMDRVILSTSLMRMGGTAENIVLPGDLNRSMNDYAFFRANLFSSYCRPAFRFISKTNIADLNFYCKAYCLSLIAEYEVLKSYNHGASD
ncbi:MAG TPA: hypothetical protein VFM99_05275 [Chitinophagales bacterium]|nr:hypothetical protein [Chitinophagales bacterium]